MIYIAVAMAIEAQEIIKFYNLKKDNTIKKFQVFKNSEVTLIITGIGVVNSLIAITYLLTTEDINSRDIFINLGIAGAKSREKYEIGDVVIANKILDRGNNIEIYPDMIFEHQFKEGSLQSFSHVVKDEKEVETDMVDMEGAAVKAAALFMETSRIFVIKIISDYLFNVDNNIDVQLLLKNNILQISDWIYKVASYNQNFEMEYEDYEREIIEKFILKMNLTESMKSSFLSNIKYYKLSDGDIYSLLNKYMNLEIKAKKEVKKILDEINKQIIK